MKDTLRHIQKRLDELGRRYDDHSIGKAWTELATDKPTERILVNGLLLVVRRRVVGFNKVEYRALLARKKEPVAWMYCQAPGYGRVQVTNANVYEVDGTDYRRRGIGSAIYDLIERDVRQSGGWGRGAALGSHEQGGDSVLEKAPAGSSRQHREAQLLGSATCNRAL